MSELSLPVKAMHKGVQNWSQDKERKLRDFISVLQLKKGKRIMTSEAIETAVDIATKELKKDLTI